MMRLIQSAGFAFAALILATSAQAAGNCQRVGAVGDGPTQTIATIMSTHGLENIIEAKGLKPQGTVKTTCKDGTVLSQCHSSQTACK